MDSVAAQMSNSRRTYSPIFFDVSGDLLLERRSQGQRVCSPVDFGVRKTNLFAKSSDGRGMGFQAVVDLCRNRLLERRPQGQRVRSPTDSVVRKTNLLAACSLSGRQMWSLGVMECCEEGIVQMEGGMLEIVNTAQVDKHPFRPRTTFLQGWEALMPVPFPTAKYPLIARLFSCSRPTTCSEGAFLSAGARLSFVTASRPAFVVPSVSLRRAWRLVTSE